MIREVTCCNSPRCDLRFANHSAAVVDMQHSAGCQVECVRRQMIYLLASALYELNVACKERAKTCLALTEHLDKHCKGKLGRNLT